MKLYIIRHGETDWNKARRVQGHSDIPLNDYGRHLAEETAEGLRDVKFDLAYTSPLVRAKETAEIVLDGRNIPLIEEDGIKELGFGAYEGMCCSGEHKASESDAFNKFFTDTANYVPAEGGESIRHLLDRTEQFLEKLYRTESLQDKTILLSTHGAAMTALLNNIKGKCEIADFWHQGVPANCAVTIVEVHNGIPKITDENLIYYKEAVKTWKVEKNT